MFDSVFFFFSFALIDFFIFFLLNKIKRKGETVVPIARIQSLLSPNEPIMNVFIIELKHYLSFFPDYNIFEKMELERRLSKTKKMEVSLQFPLHGHGEKKKNWWSNGMYLGRWEVSGRRWPWGLWHERGDRREASQGEPRRKLLITIWWTAWARRN